MPTYVYETVPEHEGAAVKRYEIFQHMRDDPLERHPETGERITRIIVGGLGSPESITGSPAHPPVLPDQPNGHGPSAPAAHGDAEPAIPNAALASQRPARRKSAPCQLCGKEHAMRDLLPAEMVRPAIAQIIEKEHPGWVPSGFICLADLRRFRSRYVKEALAAEGGEISAIEEEVLRSLRERELLSANIFAEFDAKQSIGGVLADRIAAFGGSWSFILTFGVVLLGWIALNSVALLGRPFDPYPFILLNLVLSTLAALQAPVILMSQNRMEARDRLRSEHDYKINLKAELEIRHLHEKMDHLLKHQWQRLVEIQQIQIELMEELSARARH